MAGMELPNYLKGKSLDQSTTVDKTEEKETKEEK